MTVSGRDINEPVIFWRYAHDAQWCSKWPAIRPAGQGGLAFISMSRGFTLIELVCVIAILGILAALAVPTFSNYAERARIARAVQEITVVQNEIIGFQVDHDRLPADLAAIDCGNLRDPWGNLYQYTNFETTPRGKWRKDKFLVPINSTFDLWSMGPDGRSATALTAKFSRDDIVRANDGSFIGRASRY